MRLKCLVTAALLAASSPAALPLTVVIGTIKALTRIMEPGSGVKVLLFETADPCRTGYQTAAVLHARDDYGLHVAALASAQQSGRPVALLLEQLDASCHIMNWTINPWHQVQHDDLRLQPRAVSSGSPPWLPI